MKIKEMTSIIAVAGVALTCNLAFAAESVNLNVALQNEANSVAEQEQGPAALVSFEAKGVGVLAPNPFNGRNIFVNEVVATFQIDADQPFFVDAKMVGKSKPEVQTLPLGALSPAVDLTSMTASNWQTLDGALSQISEFNQTSRIGVNYLFVTSVQFATGPKEVQFGSTPLGTPEVQSALSQLDPTQIIAVASVAPEKTCSNEPTPYWVIDVQSGSILASGVSYPCAPVPGGVSSGG
jgi:hypothetical protein